MKTVVIAAALLTAAALHMQVAHSSPFGAREEVQQRGGGNRQPISQGKGRCQSFAKANKCKPRFDKRISSCVCL
jgi:hypothetical protein